MINEYLTQILIRERMEDAETQARHSGRLRALSHPSAAPRRAMDGLRRALTIRDLGRLALVALVVMLFGLGVVGLWTAATEPRAPRPPLNELR